MMTTQFSRRSNSNNSNILALPSALPVASGLFLKTTNAGPLPRSARALELTLLEAERLLEQAFNLDEALARLTYLLATKLSVAYCRLLLASDRGLFLIPKAAYKKLADLQWEPPLNQPLPLDLLPDGLRLNRIKFSLIGIHRNSLTQEQLRDYSIKLGLREPLTGLVLIPLKIEGQLLAVLEFGEQADNKATCFSEDEIQTILLQAPRLATPLAELLRQPLIA